MSDRNWRVGRKVGRTIYDEDDNLIGTMDSPDLADIVVTSVNTVSEGTWLSVVERQEEAQRYAEARLAPYRTVLRQLLDWFESECRIDYDGVCQEHTLDNPCPVPVARALLGEAAARPEVTTGPGDSPVAASDTAAAGEPAVLASEAIAAVKAFLDVAERIIPVKLPPPEGGDEEGEGPVAWISADGLHNIRAAQRRGASHYSPQLGLGRPDDYNNIPLYLGSQPPKQVGVDTVALGYVNCSSEAAGGGHCIFLPGHDVECKFCYCDDTPCSYWTPKGAA